MVVCGARFCCCGSVFGKGEEEGFKGLEIGFSAQDPVGLICFSTGAGGVDDLLPEGRDFRAQGGEAVGVLFGGCRAVAQGLGRAGEGREVKAKSDALARADAAGKPLRWRGTPQR